MYQTEQNKFNDTDDKKPTKHIVEQAAEIKFYE